MAINTPGRKVHPRTLARMRILVFGRDHFFCQSCGWTPPVIPDPYLGTSLACNYERENGTSKLQMLELDHIVPVVSGGLFVEANLQTLCNRCNARKGARVAA